MRNPMWLAIGFVAMLGAVLVGLPPADAADAQRTAPVAPGVKLPGGSLAAPPDLSCSVWFATDSAGTQKISKPTVVNASAAPKSLYLFYSFKNAGKGNVSNYPVEATVHGTVVVGTQGGSAGNLAKAYCPNDCKFQGTININAGANIPVLKVGGAGAFVFVAASDVLAMLQGTNSVDVGWRAKGRLVQDNKDCTPAAPFTVIYKK